MSQLIFYDSGHIYELDGEQIPSVSEITRFLSREIYGEVSQYKLDQAAERGTKVHRLTEALDKYGEIEAPADVLPYLKAYLSFRKEHTVEWSEIEKAHYHPDKLYAGTIDRVGTVDGVRCILDVKTSYAVKKNLYGAQLNLYRMMLAEPVDALYILHLKPDGKYKLVELPIDDSVATACLTLHEATKKKRRKKADA